jgi:hypothetical protein
MVRVGVHGEELRAVRRRLRTSQRQRLGRYLQDVDGGVHDERRAGECQQEPRTVVHGRVRWQPGELILGEGESAVGLARRDGGVGGPDDEPYHVDVVLEVDARLTEQRER